MDGLTAAQKLDLMDGEETTVDIRARLEQQAVLCAKTGNDVGLQDALDQEVYVDCKDEFGNTLLILAGQQGNKKIAKMLLRAGADIHAQNDAGCSVLHYCYEYGKSELAQYLQSKGADDSLLNAEGLTPYEGLKKARIE